MQRVEHTIFWKWTPKDSRNGSGNILNFFLEVTSRSQICWKAVSCKFFEMLPISETYDLFFKSMCTFGVN